jgi:hypothetical protein
MNTHHDDGKGTYHNGQHEDSLCLENREKTPSQYIVALKGRKFSSFLVPEKAHDLRTSPASTGVPAKSYLTMCARTARPEMIMDMIKAEKTHTCLLSDQIPNH